MKIILIFLFSITAFAECDESMVKLESVFQSFEDLIDSPTRLLEQLQSKKELSSSEKENIKSSYKRYLHLFNYEEFQDELLRDIKKEARLYCTIDELEVIESKIRGKHNYLVDVLKTIGKSLQKFEQKPTQPVYKKQK